MILIRLVSILTRMEPRGKFYSLAVLSRVGHVMDHMPNRSHAMLLRDNISVSVYSLTSILLGIEIKSSTLAIHFLISYFSPGEYTPMAALLAF